MTHDIRFAVFDDARVAYRTVRRGAEAGAVVFIHGYAGDGSIWEAQMCGLQTPRQLIAVDLIGHGQSGAPDADYSMGYLARSVESVLDAEGIRRAVIVGWSNGVPVARQVYRRCPERTEALVAVDGLLKQVTPTEIAARMLAPLEQPDYRTTLEQMTRQKPPAAAGLSDEHWARIAAIQLATPQHVLIGSGRAMLDPSIWAETDEIRVPLLVVNARSASVPPSAWTDEYEAFVRRIAPQVEYHTREEASHFLAWEEAERFIAVLDDFLNRLDQK